MLPVCNATSTAVPYVAGNGNGFGISFSSLSSTMTHLAAADGVLSDCFDCKVCIECPTYALNSLPFQALLVQSYWLEFRHHWYQYYPVVIKYVYTLKCRAYAFTCSCSSSVDKSTIPRMSALSTWN